MGGKNIRKRTSTIIDDNILIDFGPDMLSHVHNHRLDFDNLDGIIITHSHDDHFYVNDLAKFLPPFTNSRSETSIKIYGNRAIYDLYSSFIKDNDVFEFCIVEPFKTFTIEKYKIHPLLASHGDEHENCILYVIEHEGKIFLNGNDTNIFPDETWEYLKQLKFDAVALDTTIGINPAKPPGKSGHMNIETVQNIKERLLRMGCADESTIFIMNHFSHNGGMMHHQFEDIGYDIGFQIAFDGYVVVI